MGHRLVARAAAAVLSVVVMSHGSVRMSDNIPTRNQASAFSRVAFHDYHSTTHENGALRKYNSNLGAFSPISRPSLVGWRSPFWRLKFAQPITHTAGPTPLWTGSRQNFLHLLSGMSVLIRESGLEDLWWGKSRYDHSSQSK